MGINLFPTFNNILDLVVKIGEQWYIEMLVLHFPTTLIYVVMFDIFQTTFEYMVFLILVKTRISWVWII